MKIGMAIIRAKAEVIVSTGDGLIPISNVLGEKGDYPNTLSVIRDAGSSDIIKEKLEDYKWDYNLSPNDKIQFLPIIGNPEKIICIGLNYFSHLEESKQDVPESPVIFSKYNNSLEAHGNAIKIPNSVKQLDYEGELGIVIGRTAANVDPKNALDYVYGYFAANDLSARDLQFRTSQWLLGKSGDGFFPCGPFITTADEIEDPNNLDITTIVNGEIRQNSNTSKMIFRCDYLVSYLSRYFTLKPGDIISTGTPEGVILGLPQEDRQWIRKDDVIEVNIQDIGTLSNRFV
jgi:2-keto-4-pentenoate hydratase/2-oxohepta-3-ene-1,7-dioic acid hydratase in catechol pathway